MLIKNSETNLFKQGDFNIRVTLFDKNPKYYSAAAYKEIWVKTIYDSLRGSIIHTNKQYTFCIEYPGLEKPYALIGTAAQLTKNLYSYDLPKSVRITISDSSNDYCHLGTWIIIIP